MTCEFKSHRAHRFRPRTVSVRGLAVPTTTRIRPLEFARLARRGSLQVVPLIGFVWGQANPMRGTMCERTKVTCVEGPKLRDHLRGSFCVSPGGLRRICADGPSSLVPYQAIQLADAGACGDGLAGLLKLGQRVPPEVRAAVLARGRDARLRSSPPGTSPRPSGIRPRAGREDRNRNHSLLAVR